MTAKAGLFAQNGLDIKVETFNSSVATTAALVSGQIALAATGSSAAVTASLQGAGLVNIASCWDRPLEFMFTSDPTVHSVRDLKGKLIATTRIGATDDITTRLILRQAGIPLTAVKFIYGGNDRTHLTTLQSKQVSSVVLSSPLSTEARTEGFKELYNVADSHWSLATCALIVKRSMIKSNASALSRLVKAYVQGIAYFKHNPDFAKQVMRQYMHLKKGQATQRALDQAYTETLKVLPNKPYLTDKGFQPVVDAVALVNPKASGHKASEFYDNRFVSALDKSGYIDGLYATNTQKP